MPTEEKKPFLLFFLAINAFFILALPHNKAHKNHIREDTKKKEISDIKHSYFHTNNLKNQYWIASQKEKGNKHIIHIPIFTIFALKCKKCRIKTDEKRGYRIFKKHHRIRYSRSRILCVPGTNKRTVTQGFRRNIIEVAATTLHQGTDAA